MATLNIKNFPDPLYEALRSLADRENRSVSQQVVQLISQALERHDPVSILELRGRSKQAWEGVEAGEHVDTERRTWD